MSRNIKSEACSQLVMGSLRLLVSRWMGCNCHDVLSTRKAPHCCKNVSLKLRSLISVDVCVKVKTYIEVIKENVRRVRWQCSDAGTAGLNCKWQSAFSTTYWFYCRCYRYYRAYEVSKTWHLKMLNEPLAMRSTFVSNTSVTLSNFSIQAIDHEWLLEVKQKHFVQVTSH